MKMQFLNDDKDDVVEAANSSSTRGWKPMVVAIPGGLGLLWALAWSITGNLFVAAMGIPIALVGIYLVARLVNSKKEGEVEE